MTSQPLDQRRRPPVRAGLLASAVLLLSSCSGGSSPHSLDDAAPASTTDASAQSTASAPAPAPKARGTLSTSPVASPVATNPATATFPRFCADQPADLATRPAPELAGSLLAVGVTTYEQAETAVRAGVRHLFFGTGADFTMLRGLGDPARSLDSLTALAGEPLTISTDEEGGLVQRLDGIGGIGPLPSARELRATHTPEQLRARAAAHATLMRDRGITLDFAPVLDLDGAASTTDNAIGSRSFAPDPATVTAYGTAFAQGLADAGIVPVLKHFPGHGHASGDSHHGDVLVPDSTVLAAADVLPFRDVLAATPSSALMVGHMIVPDKGDLPSSLNPAVYTWARLTAGTPRTLLITDDLSGMEAITRRHDGPQAAVHALAAGADQALLAAGQVPVDAAVTAVRDAIARGDIPERHVRLAAARAACQARP